MGKIAAKKHNFQNENLVVFSLLPEAPQQTKLSANGSAKRNLTKTTLKGSNHVPIIRANGLESPKNNPAASKARLAFIFNEILVLITYIGYHRKILLGSL